MNTTNTDNTSSNATKSPLGSLRDLIDQKTGNSNAASQDLRGDSVTGNASTSLGRRENLSSLSSRTDPLPSNENTGTTMSTATTGIGTSSASVPTSTSARRDIDFPTASETTPVDSPKTSSGSTGMFSSGLQHDTSGRTEPTSASSNQNTGRGSSNAAGVFSSGLQHDTSGRAEPMSNVSNQNTGRGSSNAAGVDYGTAVGLVGSYDYLRTNKNEPNDTGVIDTDGPEHINPPPGSREPPVTKSTGSYGGADTL